MTNLESTRAESIFHDLFLLFSYRIMFLYLGNMYVLVISLLNKINQVREMKFYWFQPFLALFGRFCFCSCR